MLETLSDYCPYCGEFIELVVDCSLTEQSYVEDCSVCCHPIVVTLVVSAESVSLSLQREDDAFNY
jgi:hypothetical protein